MPPYFLFAISLQTDRPFNILQAKGGYAMILFRQKCECSLIYKICQTVPSSRTAITLLPSRWVISPLVVRHLSSCNP